MLIIIKIYKNLVFYGEKHIFNTEVILFLSKGGMEGQIISLSKSRL